MQAAKLQGTCGIPQEDQFLWHRAFSFLVIQLYPRLTYRAAAHTSYDCWLVGWVVFDITFTFVLTFLFVFELSYIIFGFLCAYGQHLLEPARARFYSCPRTAPFGTRPQKVLFLPKNSAFWHAPAKGSILALKN